MATNKIIVKLVRTKKSQTEYEENSAKTLEVLEHEVLQVSSKVCEQEDGFVTGLAGEVVDDKFATLLKEAAQAINSGVIKVIRKKIKEIDHNYIKVVELSVNSRVAECTTVLINQLASYNDVIQAFTALNNELKTLSKDEVSENIIKLRW